MNKINELVAELLTAETHRDSRAQDAVDVSITYAVPNSRIALLKIDGRDVPRNAEGKATVALAPGDHFMEWRAYCAPHTEYAISIDAPASMKWNPDPPPLRSDSEGYVANQHTFTV